jgi:hypothetical protein
MAVSRVSLNTHVRAIVHRHGGSPVPLTGKVVEGGLDGIAVVGLSTSKGIKGSGTFSLTVKVPRSYDVDSEIQVGDWVVWWWEQNGRAYHGTVGTIVSVAESTRSKGGVTVAEYTFSCADFARVFDRTSVWFDDYSDYESNVGGKVIGSRMGWNPTGSPDAVVEQVIDAFLGRSGIIGGAWQMPPSMSWIGEHFSEGLYLSAQSSVRRGTPHRLGVGARVTQLESGVEVLLPGDEQILRGQVTGPEIAIFSPQPGTVLTQHLNGLCNDMLNELRFDVLTHDTRGVQFSRPDMPTPCVFAWERPFVNSEQGLRSPWFRLPTTRLLTSERVAAVQTATNENERVNLILLYASNLGWTQLDQYALYPPSYDLTDIRRHGIAKMERETLFAGVGQHGASTWAEEIREWHKLLASWYGPNHLWRAGSVTVGGVLPDARPGNRLLIDDNDDKRRRQFYIEEVTSQWKFPEGGTTTLGVTRGFKGSDADLVAAVSARAESFQREAYAGAPALVPAANLSRPGRAPAP